MVITKKISPNLIYISKQEAKSQDTLPVYMLSDVHFDNPKCNRDLFFKHMNQAKAEGGRVIITGDFFCFMQGKYDPRRNKKDIRPEHNVHNYIDAVVDEAVEKLMPYKNNLSVISYGNHETGILKNLETDVTDRLVQGLRREGSDVEKGGYMGFIKVGFNTKGRESKSFHLSKMIGYHHGHWGGVISKGTQGVPRFGLVMPDADIIHTGHSHDQWLVNQPRYKMQVNGDLIVTNQWHIKSGTYKEEFTTGMGWAVERIVMPKALGMWKIDFKYIRTSKNNRDKSLIEETITPLN